MSWNDAELHVRGEAHFTADELPDGCLRAAVFSSPVARGEIRRLDVSAACRVPEVAAVLTARDIPGQNQIGNIVLDETLLAEQTVHYAGQPIALVIAGSEAAARHARSGIVLEVCESPGVFDPREAYLHGEIIGSVRTFALGDVDRAWPRCDRIVEGRVDSGAQEHVYLETQNALAVPLEGGRLKILSSTQSPALVQRVAARVLGVPMNQIEVEVGRVGGAFGGKEEQAVAWAVMVAVAAARLRRPVKLVLPRAEDMRITGKRHPYSSDFKIGTDNRGRILAYEANYFQDAGAAADLSPAVLERSMLHATGSYFVPNVRVRGACCRTNYPPNTAFRAFGAPQATFVIESAIFAMAQSLGVDPAELQQRNLLREADAFCYGMHAENCRAVECWNEAEKRFAIRDHQRRIVQFNRRHLLEKKGLALIPLCFGISFTNSCLNQASALVHVYVDGSVSVSTGAVELGQGVRAKIQQVAARTLGVGPGRVKVEITNTARIANASPTAASTGADLNGQATRTACLALKDRLKQLAARLLGSGTSDGIECRDEVIHRDGVPTALTWDALITRAYLDRASLSAHAHYATPHLYFDRSREKGRPFAYHVYGTGVVEVALDCLRGTYRFTSVEILHDAGVPLDRTIDRGQVEGGVVQGLGWISIEEIRHDQRGRMLTDSLTSYKIPDLDFSPDLEVVFLEQAENPAGLYQSKAIGEPPFLYGIAGYFALMKAVLAFRPDARIGYDAPLTPEKVLMSLYHSAGGRMGDEPHSSDSPPAVGGSA
jgi:xanthine dehydrogenase large subunit